MHENHIPNEFHIFVQTNTQLDQLYQFMKCHVEFGDNESHIRQSVITRIYVNSDIILQTNILHDIIEKSDIEIVLALPPVLRDHDIEYLDKTFHYCESNGTGVLVRNLEGLGFFRDREFCGKIYADYSFYLWNSHSIQLWDGILSGACLPLELNAAEQHSILRFCMKENLKNLRLLKENPNVWEKLIYGRIPMMQTANCILKTIGVCQKENKRKQEYIELNDRMDFSFPVVPNCSHCFNTIYNSLPLSLHSELDGWQEPISYRIDFTIETQKEMNDILEFLLFHIHRKNGKCNPPFHDYTTGHEKRGVI